ncbi:ion channel [Chitinophagaceae bacterium 26-R-25]|nr:ion channel [Chitinophagaceae bacterium 26-R-25]
MGKKIKLLWTNEVGLTILLCILFIQIFIVIPLGQKTIFGKVIFSVFYFCLLATGILIFFKNYLLKVFGAALLVLFILGAIFSSPTLTVTNDTLLILYSMMLSWVVLLRTFSAGAVTIHRVFGAVVVYLLIGFIFALMYETVYFVDDDTAFKGLSLAERKEFMYFSLTTLTTVGYGDIIPLLPFSRSLANMEALIGQLYPAILIARLVSMEIDAPQERKKK